MGVGRGSGLVLTGWSLGIYLFLYAPILVLCALSFNASRLSGAWEGFTLDWYVRALENLVENASQAGAGVVTLCAGRHGDSVQLLVDDDAPGVPADLQQRIFEPAGMRQTGFPLEAEQPEGHAIGYTREGAGWKPNQDIAWRRGLAAGGAHSTATDLLRFAQALLDGRLLKPAMLAEATRPQIPEGWYGLGFTVVGKGPLRRIGHGGDAPGINADVRIFPESGYVLVAFSNIDPPAAYRAFRWFEPRMPLERTPAPVATSR